MATKINAAQIKKIHALKGALAMDDDTYRAVLAGQFNATSSKNLTGEQAHDLLSDLEHKAVAAGKWEKRDRYPASSSKNKEMRTRYNDLETRRGNMASPAQLRKIEAQWAEVTRAQTPEESKRALRHFLERVVKVSDLRFLDAAGAGKVINGLTEMQINTGELHRRHVVLRQSRKKARV